MEFWERKAEDDGERRSGNIAEQERPEARNAPVAAAADNRVEIAAELVSLNGVVHQIGHSVDGKGGWGVSLPNRKQGTRTGS